MEFELVNRTYNIEGQPHHKQRNDGKKRDSI